MTQINSTGRGKIRRVKRRLFNLLAAVSLVLCIVPLFCWITAADSVITWEAGTIARSPPASNDCFNYCGFSLTLVPRVEIISGGTDLFCDAIYRLAIPNWAIAGLFACLPLIRVLQQYRNRPIPEGSCIRCGYDLRASKDRCPECGKAIPAAAGAEAK